MYYKNLKNALERIQQDTKQNKTYYVGPDEQLNVLLKTKKPAYKKKILSLTSYSKRHINVVSKNDDKTMKNDGRTTDIKRPISGQRQRKTNKKQRTMQQKRIESTGDVIDLNKTNGDRNMIVPVKQHGRFLITLV